MYSMCRQPEIHRAFSRWLIQKLGLGLGLDKTDFSTFYTPAAPRSVLHESW